MGVTKVFHFRRFLRRGRRVEDGSRHFVIGLDKTSEDANSASLPSTATFPKGSHFLVAFGRGGGVQLSEEELDACNNNTLGNDELNDATRNGSQQESDANSSSSNPRGASVLFAVMPGAGSTNSRLNVPGENGASNLTSSSMAVVTTTELEETQLFGRK